MRVWKGALQFLQTIPKVKLKYIRNNAQRHNRSIHGKPKTQFIMDIISILFYNLSCNISCFLRKKRLEPGYLFFLGLTSGLTIGH